VSDKESKNSIQVIERMMKLLEVLADSPDAVSLKLLAGRAGLHPSTAHRILTALVRDRMAERVEQGSYRLGMRLLELGNLVKSRIIERTSSGRSLMRVVNIIGARAPLHSTAVGKLFLLDDGPEGVKAYAERTGLPGYTKNTIQALPALERELERVRRQGYALDNEEAELGVRCIGAGVRDDTGALVSGLSVSAPAERMKPAWASLVKETAERISRAIGYRSAQAA
jgi:DNA-binding IclR family transcriptional regulator